MDWGYVYHRLVVGYHGCDRATVERVLVLLEHESLEPSNNTYDWLGRGIYFWEHGYKRALEFAEWKEKRGDLTEPTVLGAYIHLGRCFEVARRFAGHRYTSPPSLRPVSRQSRRARPDCAR
jgi:hypothetical protein